METQIWTIYTCFWLTLLGAVAGSFLECAVSRWAAGQPPFSGRSRCSACGRTLARMDKARSRSDDMLIIRRW